MAQSEQQTETDTAHHDVVAHQKTYQWMMDFGFQVGVPVSGAITLFVALLLMDVHFFVALFLSILGWLGMLGIVKAFFTHH